MSRMSEMTKYSSSKQSPLKNKGVKMLPFEAYLQKTQSRNAERKTPLYKTHTQNK